MTTLFAVFSLLVIVQLVYPFVTILLAQGVGKEKLVSAPHPEKPDYACIITAYRNAAIAQPLLISLLRQSYPHLTVYLVADDCPDVDVGIADERFVYLRPEIPLHLKVKSIRYAVDHFKHDHSHIAVFDADNLAHPDFLAQINRFVQAGYRCIQGRRTAKNLDTTYAALDSLGEHYKNYIERQVPFLLGGSAVISGSGMVTASALYRAYLASPEIEQGQHQWKKMLQEDKILQNFMVRQGERIGYARQAVVYDEKVATGEAVETQRSRWLYSYFQNLPNSGALLLRGMIRMNFNQWYFGFVTLVLPMFLQLVLAGILFLAGLWVAPVWSLALLGAVGVFALGILWTLRLDGAPQPVWDAVWQVPRFVFRQAMSLLKMRNPDKHFKHTEHTKQVSVEELLKK